MESYNYKEAVVEDVYDYLVENEITWSSYNRDRVEGNLQDELFVSGVTGNDNGSYTFSTSKAHQYIQGDRNAMQYIREMARDFGCSGEDLSEHFMDEDWEWFDVSIRCYLLYGAISDAMDMVEEENPYKWNEDEDEEEDEEEEEEEENFDEDEE